MSSLENAVRNLAQALGFELEVGERTLGEQVDPQHVRYDLLSSHYSDVILKEEELHDVINYLAERVQDFLGRAFTDDYPVGL